MPERVAVVGAGALGLMGVKNLREAGFSVTGFESRAYVGGLWKDSPDNSISVHETTVFNSSKFRAAISDFPFPEDIDDFPTAPQMHRYLESYAHHFDLQTHYQLNTRVKAIKHLGKQWALEVQTREEGVRTEYFDRVCFSTGSFSTPKFPNLLGQELFAGKMSHSIDYHGPQPYRDQNVLLVGIHASAQDVAVSLAEKARKLWMAHREGVLLFPRYMPNGGAFDQNGGLAFTQIAMLVQDWAPNLWNWLFDKICANLSKTAYPGQKPEWGLSPAPSISVAPPLIGDRLYPLLESGFATPVAEIKQITGPKTVELTSGQILTDIDSIIFCTGYNFAIPFSPEEFNPYPIVGEPPLLYRNIFPISANQHIRETLAYMGQVGIPFPGFVQHELPAVAIAQTWLNSSLPSYTEMTTWHQKYLAWRADLKSRHNVKHNDSVFYTAFVPLGDHLRWLDKICGTGVFEHFNWFTWRSWEFWWNDREFYNEIKYGLFSPAIWRVFDMGYGRKAWDGARACVKEDNRRAKKQREERKARLDREKAEDGKKQR